MGRLTCAICLIAASVYSISDTSAQTRVANSPVIVRSAKSGSWSSPDTWEGGKIPEGGVVQIRSGHAVIYDVESTGVFRAIHVAGTLRFTQDKNTRLDVCLLRIQAGDKIDIEDGFDCDAHIPEPGDGPRPALEVGTPEQPIQADKRAQINLRPWHIDQKLSDSLPAIVCCGGRMDFHGAPMSRTWVKLGAAARKGDTTVTLAEPVEGWHLGDSVLLTGTTRQNKQKKTFHESVSELSQTESLRIKAIQGKTLTLEGRVNPGLNFDHLGEGDYRGEIANLTRNVSISSPPFSGYSPSLVPQKKRERVDHGRGHVMYHRNSTGSISYAGFYNLGKPGVLGRYALHFHLCGDTMRGSSVIGCSFLNSYNRWLTIHGTNYLVVRDCVGYQSFGHGFFMEDGTEVNNILDRNLAVQAYAAKPLPKQVIPFDKNDGSGFWWANCQNSFTRNVAAECDEYGYFFQAAKTKDFDPNLRVLRPDGSRERVDIRTLPFIRFEDNVTHCQRRHGFNLGGGVPFGEPNVGGVGPDVKHPFEIRNFKAYNTHWAIHPVAPSVAIDGMDVVDSEYGVWRPVYKDHAYRGIQMTGVPDKTQYAFVNPSQPPIPEAKYPGTLQPVDDLPPVTVITHVLPGLGGKLIVRGSTADNGAVKRVLVNGQPAKATTANFLTWEVILDSTPAQVTAYAEDEAGNVEKMKHVRAAR